MSDDIPCMYSGELLSSDTYENYFFYWLHPRPSGLKDPNRSDYSGYSDSPLIIYLNGGPGSSTMNALWTGNGPLRVSETDSKTKGDDFAITYDTDISWAPAGDLLWIDQPVGTGWSWGEKMVTNLDEIGDAFLQFLLSFYEEYPVYKERELVLTGESFAGKYLSYSAKAILDYNDGDSNSFTFNLNNMILSNPLVNTPVERLQQTSVGWALGFYDDFQTDQVEVLKRHCEEAPSLGYDPADQSTACKNILNYVTKPIGSVEQMDASHFNYEDFIDNDSFTDLFSKSDRLTELKTALHITKTETYERTNSTVADAITDRENDATDVYTQLHSRGLHILINVGNYDQKDGVRSQLEWVKGVDMTDREVFDEQPRKKYTYLDQFDSSEELVGGWYRHHDNFTVIVTPQAGHMVPAYQPYLSMQYVMDFIEKGYLYCSDDKQNGSCSSVASYMCTYMNDCNGNGSCNSYGKCECDSGFISADCSQTATSLSKTGQTSKSKTIDGALWTYYKIQSGTGDSAQLTVTSDKAVSVYVRKGLTDVPDTVTFDILDQETTNSRLIIDGSDGAYIAIHCTGYAGTDSTTFTLTLDANESEMVKNSFEFLDLAAAAAPSAPQFGVPERDISGGKDGEGLLSNIQFMMLGAFFGIIATVIYYQIARFCQQYYQSKAQTIRISSDDMENGAACESLEDPNTYLFRNERPQIAKTFKEDEDSKVDEE